MVWRGGNCEWFRGFTRYLGSCNAYITEFWSVLEGLRLTNKFGFGIIELHINSKVVVKNNLDFGQDSIIEMLLVQQIQPLFKLEW